MPLSYADFVSELDAKTETATAPAVSFDELCAELDANTESRNVATVWTVVNGNAGARITNANMTRLGIPAGRSTKRAYAMIAAGHHVIVRYRGIDREYNA